MRPPRVAYFPDSFHEVNGVAHTSRNFVAYAQRHHLPFLCVRAGSRTPALQDSGNLRTLELSRSRASIRIEKDLKFDTLFWRHGPAIQIQLQRFRPDILHITGPSELGILGAWFAWALDIPLAASWHTNVHEYAARRLSSLTQRLAGRHAASTEHAIESSALWIAGQFYRLAQLLFAPNSELCAMLEHTTGRPCHLMQRGVDTTLFNPDRRTRPPSDHRLVLGYVGRLSVEKNVALLAHIERQLLARNIPNVEFLIVGHGDEEPSLRASLQHAVFPGVLRGDALATAYGNMDLLVFPSHTDTFGNVVLEALASGVPAIVTPSGGPKFIVQHGHTGFIAANDDFAAAIATLAHDPQRLARMRLDAREYALTCSWDAVFDRVYAAYDTILPPRLEAL
jgi:glycosyltransferase involved in cell wall biosynthesis